jgi:hypothetical protein
MIFTSDQIADLLKVINYQTILFGVEFLGKEPLELGDEELLEEFGEDLDDIDEQSYVDTAYKFGILSKAIGDNETKNLKYNDFKKWIQKGGNIPLTTQEQSTVKYLKRKSFSHLKNLGNKIGSDVKNILLDQENKHRLKNQKLIRKELITAVRDRTDFKEVMLNLGHKTDDWMRDWDRIVQTELHTAYEEGRADDIQRNSKSDDPLVFKHVLPTACRHCIKAYLTDGLGSKPRIFKLSELRANGSNIGRKQQDWLPTLDSLHPWDRCTLDEYIEDYNWDREKKTFEPPIEFKRKIERKSKVYITIGTKEYIV